MTKYIICISLFSNNGKDLGFSSWIILSLELTKALSQEKNYVPHILDKSEITLIPILGCNFMTRHNSGNI